MLTYLFTALQPYVSGFRVFRYITFRTALAVITALVISFLIGPAVIRLLTRWQIGQTVREEGPRHHQIKAGTPTMGGVLILLSVLGAVLCWGEWRNPFFLAVVGAYLAFSAIGFADDALIVRRRRNLGLTKTQKLIWQGLAGIGFFLVLMWFVQQGWYTTVLSVPFLKTWMPDLGWGYGVLTLLVLVGTANAVNLTDGLDGLAVGSVLIASATYAVLTYLAGHAVAAGYLDLLHLRLAGEVTVFCGALVGASLGFLWFNAHPAQVFMGDVGSMGLGGAIGAVALLVKQELLLVVVGGLFVVEALSVMIQVASFRWRGRRVFRMAPLHHHFELSGWAEPQVIIRFWILAFLFALLGLSTLKLR